MTKSEMATRLNNKSAWPEGKRVKFDFGAEGVVVLDGVAKAVTEEDGPADATILISWEDLQALRSRQLDPMSALMQGRLKVEGDLSAAMQLQSVISKLAG